MSPDFLPAEISKKRKTRSAGFNNNMTWRSPEYSLLANTSTRHLWTVTMKVISLGQSSIFE